MKPIQAPTRIQLAIQGGGARLAELLVALDVVQQYERDGKLLVTRVAGTSAGAIAGAIFACGNTSVERALGHLERRAPEAARRIMPQHKSWFNRIVLLTKLLQGKALCDPREIRNEIEALIQAASNEISTIRDLTKPFVALSTDLLNRKSKVLKDADLVLVDTLFNSAAIPFLFKGAKDCINPFVDGGLCDNLPIDALRTGEIQDDIFAISFFDPPSNNHPRSTIALFRELFNCAINNSIQRSSSQLSSHAILPIKSRIDALDFETAFDTKRHEAHFDNIRIRTRTWLDTNVIGLSKRLVVPVYKDNLAAQTLMSELYSWYKSSYATIPRRVLRDTVMIIAHSLQPPHGNPDILDDLIKEVVFEPTTHPIPCIHFSFGVDEILDLEKDIELEDFNKIPVPFRILPTSESVDKKSGGKQTYFGYLIAFNEPLLPQSTSSSPYKAPFKMRYRTKLKDAFNPLRIGKELSTHPDEFAHDVSTEGNHEVVELIMFYPENFFIKSNPRYRSTPTSEWQSCSSIDLTALDRISYLAPKGYQKIGWISKNLQMGGEVQVDLWR